MVPERVTSPHLGYIGTATGGDANRQSDTTSHAGTPHIAGERERLFPGADRGIASAVAPRRIGALLEPDPGTAAADWRLQAALCYRGRGM